MTRAQITGVTLIVAVGISVGFSLGWYAQGYQIYRGIFNGYAAMLPQVK